MASTPVTLEELEREVRKLSRADRARLVESIVAALEEESEIEEAWRHEIQRRAAALDAGSVELVPEETVLAELEAIAKK